jgi:hypothetical protein
MTNRPRRRGGRPHLFEQSGCAAAFVVRRESEACGTLRSISMKLAGFLLLLAGGVIAAASIAILTAKTAMTGFLLAGIAVELIGIALVFRAHMPPKEGREERG